MDWNEWCQRAVEHVRFQPDRKGIARELTDHYIDHRRDLERLGYPMDLASERALTAMGDAEEVGTALDRAHKPALGWLWLVSRILVLLCMGAVLWTAIREDGWFEISRDVQMVAEEIMTGDSQSGDAGRLAAVVFASDEVRQTFQLLGTACSQDTVERSGLQIGEVSGSLWQAELENGETACYLSAVLTVENPRFWENWPYGPDLGTMILTDSTGQDYWTNNAKWEAGLGSVEEGDPDYLPIYALNSRRTGLTRRIYSLGAFLQSGTPVDWVELRYPLGEGFTFRLDFQEVAS